MRDQKTCPDERVLESLLNGLLPLEQEEEITRHLEMCAACEQRAQQLEQRTDPLIEALRQPQLTARIRTAAAPQTEHAFAAVSSPPVAAEPFQLDGYRIVREVGRGGMGVVYEAYQHRLHRPVAVKMILAGTLAGPEERVRFMMEGELLARLNHPNFVQVYEVGTVELSAGTVQPYLVLEYVDGGSLRARITGRLLPFEEAARLLLILAHAVEVAHAQGIIHRDLKPANVLIAGDGSLKITDFGLAKELGANASLTPTGLTVGTPNYMAPEQTAGRSAPIGPATDVYALGAILYEMLSGKPPFEGETPMEVLLQVLNKQPVSLARVRAGMPRDLETICLKCLEKEPRSRYASAADLARDLECWLDNRPIAARSAGRLERVYKWTRRHPLPAAMIAVIVVSLLAGSITSTYFGITATRRADETQEALQKEEAARTLAERATEAERWERYLAEIAAASNALRLNNLAQARHALESAPALYRNWEWQHLYSQLDGARTVLEGHKNIVGNVSLSADGKRLVSVSDEVLRVWDLPAGKEVSVIRPPSGRFNNADISPDGTRVAVGGERMRLWDAGKGKLLWETAEAKKGLNGPVWSPDGRYLAGTARDGLLRVWDAASGREIFARQCNPYRGPVVFRPDGRHVATNQTDHVVCVWETATGREVSSLRGHQQTITTIAYSPDGRRLATGSIFDENEARIWDEATGKLLFRCKGHANEVVALAFSPDGKTLASGSMDQSIRLWDVFTGRELATLKGHTDFVNDLLFSPDGKMLISTSRDQTLCLWDPEARRLIAVLHGHGGSVGTVRYGAGNLVASASTDGTVRLWDAELIARNGVLRGHKNFVYDVAFHPGGNQVASASWDGTVRLWNPTTGRQIGAPLDARPFRQDRAGGYNVQTPILTGLACSPDGVYVAVAAREDGVCIWDLASRRGLALPPEVGGRLNGDSRPAFNPQSTLLAWGNDDGSVRILKVKGIFQSVQKARVLPGEHDGSVRDVAFSPDGRQLASAGEDRKICLWDTATWKLQATLAGSATFRVVYSPDGRLLAAGAGDNTVRVWSLASGKQTALFHLGGSVYGLAFNSDGTRLACACADNTIRLCDLVKNREVADLRGHEVYTHAVMFSPDGTRLVSCSGDYTVRIWDTLSAQARALAEKR